MFLLKHMCRTFSSYTFGKPHIFHCLRAMTESCCICKLELVGFLETAGSEPGEAIVGLDMCGHKAHLDCCKRLCRLRNSHTNVECPQCRRIGSYALVSVPEGPRATPNYEPAELGVPPAQDLDAGRAAPQVNAQGVAARTSSQASQASPAFTFTVLRGERRLQLLLARCPRSVFLNLSPVASYLEKAAPAPTSQAFARAMFPPLRWFWV